MLVVTQRSVYMIHHQKGMFRLTKVANNDQKAREIVGRGAPTPVVGREFAGASLTLQLGRPLILADSHGEVIVRSTPVTAIEM